MKSFLRFVFLLLLSVASVAIATEVASTKLPYHNKAKYVDLDALALASAQIKPDVMLLPNFLTMHVTATVDMLPKLGKTAYMVERMQQLGQPATPAVSHKMWLKTKQGKLVMAYVRDDIAEKMHKQLTKHQHIHLVVQQYWKYYQGPGLLIIGFELLLPEVTASTKLNVKPNA